jgi:hypothetical protein
VAKRQVGLAFGHFGRFSLCPRTFFPNLSDLAVVVVQNNRRVANREAKKHEQRDTNRPHGTASTCSRTSYSNATPSGSFSSNQISRGFDRGEGLDVVDIADLLGGFDVDDDGH